MPATALDQTTSVVDLAEHAAVIIRELTHRTRGRHAFTEPAELARLLDALTATASGLPQLLDQLSRWLGHEHDAERLQADTHNDTDQLVAAATTSLAHGRQAAHALTAALDAAHQPAAHLATAPPNRNTMQGVNFHP
jgi:hypothetical protein